MKIKLFISIAAIVILTSFSPMGEAAVNPPCTPVLKGYLIWPLPPAGEPWPDSIEYPDLETCKAAQISFNEYLSPINHLYFQYAWNETTVISDHYYTHEFALGMQNLQNNWFGTIDSGGCMESCILLEPPAINLNFTNECGVVTGVVEMISPTGTEPITTTYIWPGGTGTTTTSQTPIPRDNVKSVALTFPDGTVKTADVSYSTQYYASLTLADFGYPNGYPYTGQTATFTIEATLLSTGDTITSSTTVQNKGLDVTVVAEKTTIEPTLPERRDVIQNGDNETPVTVTVLDQNGAPANGANVSLSVERASTRYGGHDHDTATIADSTRPKGTLKVPSGTTGTNGIFSST